MTTHLEMIRRSMPLEELTARLTSRVLKEFRFMTLAEAGELADRMVTEFDTYLACFSRKDHPEADEEFLFDEFGSKVTLPY